MLPKDKAPASRANPARQLTGRVKRMKALRQPWEATIQEAYDFTMPMKQGMFDQAAEGERKTRRIYDETAVIGAAELVSRIQSNMIPPFMQWLTLEAGVDVEEAEDKTATDQALAIVTKQVFQDLNESNFNAESAEAIADMIVTTGILWSTKDPGEPIVWRALPLGTTWIDNGPDGKIDAVAFEERLMMTHVRVKYPKARLPDRWLEEYGRIEAGEQDDRPVTIVHLARRVYGPAVETYAWEAVAHCADDELLFQEKFSGQGSCPFVAFRWSKLSGETWGRGPVLNVMPAIMTCNLTVQLILENAELALGGVYTLEDDGVMNFDNIRLVPGTILPVAPGSQGLKAVGSAANFDVSQLVLGDMRMNIRKGLFNEQMGNPQGGRTPLSAYEVAERQSDLARAIGTNFGRIYGELAVPVIHRVLYFRKRDGLLALPKVNGSEIRVRATSPLSRSQKMQNVQASGQVIDMINGRFGPQTTNLIFDGQKTAKYWCDELDVEPGIIRTDAEIKQIAAMIEQQSQQAPSPDEQSSAGSVL